MLPVHTMNSLVTSDINGLWGKRVADSMTRAWLGRWFAVKEGVGSSTTWCLIVFSSFIISVNRYRFTREHLKPLSNRRQMAVFKNKFGRSLHRTQVGAVHSFTNSGRICRGGKGTALPRHVTRSITKSSCQSMCFELQLTTEQRNLTKYFMALYASGVCVFHFFGLYLGKEVIQLGYPIWI